MSLDKYNRKRDFEQTSEPKGETRKSSGKLKFVVQRHDASKLHYDFRLEMEGVLKSWAVPKGPSMNPADKRLAVEVEDHPFSYRTFEGDIPEGNYGAGHVDIWDEGTYFAAETENGKDDEKKLLQGLKEGNLKFVLQGQKLRGEFVLIKMKGRQKDAWLLIKKDDKEAVSEPYDAEAHTGKIKAAKTDTKSKNTDSKKTETSKAKSKKNASNFPHPVSPMMAKLTDEPFDDDDWIFEIKWDGYRAIAEVNNGNIALYSRNGKSYGNKYPPILDSLKQLKNDVVLDGEIVVLNEEGYATFQQLQNFQNSPSEHLYFYAFDLLFLNGEDLRDLPLIERKKRLKEILPDLPAIRYSDHVKATGKAFFKEAQRKQVEGIMAKLASGPYHTGKRSSEWLKIKTHLRQEAVIAGFTEPKGKRKHIGALVLGVYEKGKLVYVGQSGSGFNSKTLKDLNDRLQPLIRKTSPFSENIKTNAPVTWVKPALIAEISFAEWTDEGIMRQAVYQGLREDKDPKEVVKEKAMHTPKAIEEAEHSEEKTKPKSSEKTTAKTKTKPDGEALKIGKRTVPLSSLDKLYWPEENISKGDLIYYYQSIAKVILPYLKDRPQSLFRTPEGITKKGFFQKDMPNTPDWVRTEKIRAASTGEKVEYLVCDDKATLAYMNNLGCIQLNPWNSRLAAPDKPDFLVLDLDPGENTYDEVVQVALVVKEVLDKAGADSYVKTSGATGMHIYLPLHAKYAFEQVKQFAQIIAELVHEKLPELTSLERNPKERRKLIYLDYLQNTIGQTVAAPYSARPIAGAPVSAPLLWKEVKPGLRPETFTIQNMPARIKKMGDIFNGVLGKGIDLKKCLKNLES